MTQDEIMEMARQAGLPEAIIEMTPIAFEVFAKLVATKEREACAKLCETEMRDWYASQNKTAQSKIMLYTAVYDCAAAIRARGQE